MIILSVCHAGIITRQVHRTTLSFTGLGFLNVINTNEDVDAESLREEVDEVVTENVSDSPEIKWRLGNLYHEWELSSAMMGSTWNQLMMKLFVAVPCQWHKMAQKTYWIVVVWWYCGVLDLVEQILLIESNT